MKNLFLVAVASCFAVFNGCAALSGGGANSSVSVLSPDDIVGKNMVGSDADGTYSFLFQQNGVLKHSVNGTAYTGTWKFDANKKMLKYNLNWTEKGKEQDYGADIFKRGDEITIRGYWTLTESLRTYVKKVKFE